jgi:hypothetical protein
LTMYMNMTIIMTMNIYITKENEEWLREQTESMSGIVNSLLNVRRGGVHQVMHMDGMTYRDPTPPSPKPVKVPSPRVSVEEVADIFNAAPLANLITADKLATKLCQHGANPRFCKHAKNGKVCK